MISKQSVMAMAEKFLPKEKLNRISQAYDFADKLTSITNNPQEIITRAGITKTDLDKARKLINNPLAGLILGNNKQSVIEGLNKAESLLGNNSLVEQPPASELEQMQANLAKLK